MYIGGELVDSSDGNTFEVVNPADLSKVSTIAWASKENTERTLLAAKEGFEFWSVQSVAFRVEWMHKLRNKLIEAKDLLRESVMYEMGKTWEGTEEDLSSIIDSLEFYATEIQNRKDVSIDDKEGTHKHSIVSQPVGVVVAFLAYNFPLLNLGFKLGPALAAGCSIILKPSEFSPLSAYILGELCHEINFPSGVINVICGDVENVGIPLCESTIVRLITMIGSTETAQKLIGQSIKTSIKRYSMECGGNAPFIVFDDADLNLAIEIAGNLKIGNSGQICVAPNRFYIHENVVDQFVAGLKHRFSETELGFGRDHSPDMGPLANGPSLEKVDSIVKEAIKQGGKLIVGGNKIEGSGYYYEPTIVRIPNNKAEIFQEEIFGPVANVTTFATKEEALALANNTSAGLASYVFSKNQETLRYFADRLEFGEVQLNGVKYDIYLPHGGVKNSGIGMDCSSYALDEYLIKKRITEAIMV